MSTVIEKNKNTLYRQITANSEIHHPNNKCFNPGGKKRAFLGIQFNFARYGRVTIQTGSKMEWCSRSLKWPLFITGATVKEQALLTEEDASGNDQ